jgi:3-methyladenine DNA glycosylase AlkC
LPKPFPDAAAIMLDGLHPDDDVNLSNLTMDQGGIRGWAVMPMCSYVADHGLDDFDLALNVLKEFTKRFTAELSFRTFILSDQERTLSVLRDWAGDPNYHVRRLASEGSRPRLPWAMRLPALMADPAPLLPILELLKDDSEEYVRRSVANNLNDIAKDHPDIVAGIAGEWLRDATPERAKLVRHACRTLIKQGHKATLSALGYGPPQLSLAAFEIKTKVVRFGEALLFDISLQSEAATDQALILDYVVHHRKANGKTTAKVFKWKNVTLKAGVAMSAARKHPMRPITTRVYYPGTHFLEILVNGESLGRAEFQLEMPE